MNQNTCCSFPSHFITSYKGECHSNLHYSCKLLKMHRTDRYKLKILNPKSKWSLWITYTLPHLWISLWMSGKDERGKISFKNYFITIISVTTYSDGFGSSVNDAIYSESLLSALKQQKSHAFKSAARIYYIWKRVCDSYLRWQALVDYFY